MKPEIAVLDLQGQFRVHTELHRAEAAEKTIILVNGSLATTASFAQTVRNLHPHYNVVLFDQPYAGKSKPYNPRGTLLTKACEARILLELIEHFGAEHVMSFSWGGASTLIALSQRPRRVEKAVVSSFSPVINTHMRDYLEHGVVHLDSCNRAEVGNLINDHIGKFLPPLFKRFNHRHVSGLDLHEYRQMRFHVDQVMGIDAHCYLKIARSIDIPVLFMNGDRDEYTTPDDARRFTEHLNDCHFRTICGAGHFLDMENKNACRDTRQALLDFLGERPRRQRDHPRHVPQAMAV